MPWKCYLYWLLLSIISRSHWIQLNYYTIKKKADYSPNKNLSKVNSKPKGIHWIQFNVEYVRINTCCIFHLLERNFVASRRCQNPTTIVQWIKCCWYDVIWLCHEKNLIFFKNSMNLYKWCKSIGFQCVLNDYHFILILIF